MNLKILECATKQHMLLFLNSTRDSLSDRRINNYTRAKFRLFSFSFGPFYNETFDSDY